MRVVVIGAGRVGHGLVTALDQQGHRLVVVDRDPDALRAVSENHDVGVVEGYGPNLRTLRDAGCGDADLVVAVTDQDETNIVAAQAARQLGAKRVIARVRSEGWSDLGGGDGVELGLLGVDVLFNPRVLVAREMARIARSHGALEVVNLADDRIELVKLPVSEASRFRDKPLSRGQFPAGVKVGAVVRDGRLFVPGGADVLAARDEVILIGRREAIDEVQEHVTGQSVARRVCIMGGGVIGMALARMLVSAGAEVLVLERDRAVAERLAQTLDRVRVVLGDGTDIELMREHRVDGYHLFAAVTEDEEVNLLGGLLAKKLGVERVTIVIQRTEFQSIYHQIGMDVVLSIRGAAEEHVLRYARDEVVRSLTMLEGGAAEVVELKVPTGARIAGKPLSGIRLPRGSMVCAILKPGGVVIPTGDETIDVGDTVVMLSTADAYDAMAWHFKAGVFG